MGGEAEVQNQGQGGIDYDWEVLGSHELEKEQRDQLYAFRSALTDCYALNGARVIDVDRLPRPDGDTDKSLSEQMKGAVIDRVTRKTQRLWLSPEYEWLGYAGLGNFNVIRTASAETSAHHVFFGIMHGGEPEGRGLKVAIKPCVENRTTACSDWLNATLAAKNGERGYKTVGFMFHDGTGYSITELDESTDTLDNTNWGNVLVDESDLEYMHQVAILGDIAKKLADLHNKNVFHGDPQFKNIALDVTGETFFIDWESATFFGGDQKYSDILHKSEHDLRVLFSSMARSEKAKGVGILSDFTHSVQWVLFKKHIFDPYMEERLEKAEDPGLVFDLVADIEERLEQYITNGELYTNLRRARSN